MNAGLIVDIVVAVILLFFVYRGFVNGFSGEIIGFVGLFVAIFCAWNFLDPAVDLVFKHFSHPALDRNIVSLICAVAIFFIVEIIFGIIGLILSYVVRVTRLSMTDHFFGMLIGVLKASFIILAVYAVLTALSPLVPTDWMKDSYSMTAAESVWPYVRDFMQSKGLLDLTHLTGNAN